MQGEWDDMVDYAKSYLNLTGATEALRSRLDSASKSVAAQDFRHMAQRED